MSEDADKKHEIYWRGELIGYLKNLMPDMYYLEGEWIPIECDALVDFSDEVGNQSWDDFHATKESDFIWVGLNKNEPNYLFVTITQAEVNDTTVDFMCIRMTWNLKPPEIW